MPTSRHDAPGVAWIALADRHHRHAVGARLRGQPAVDNLGKLAAQHGHEQLVEHAADHGGLVGRPAGVSRDVDRCLAPRDRGDAHDGETLHRIVVAGVISERAFLCRFRGRYAALEHDLGISRLPRSTPEKVSSEVPFGSGRTALSMVAGSAPITTATGMSALRPLHNLGRRMR